MTTSNQKPFKAETKQLLDILINSLYSDRDVFLREIISNASDAITRLNFEMLTNHDVVDADAEPAIRIRGSKDAKTLIITDNGIGMNAEEIEENLGTIARSGARSFLEATKDQGAGAVSDLIGQFGVGFYAAFMVAESIDVISRSYRPGEEAVKWSSTGSGVFTIEPSVKTSRGTEIIIHLKDDALEYTDDFKLREIVRKHSNYIPYPIYIGDGSERANADGTLWRKPASEVTQEDYEKFYQSFTMDFEKPLAKQHLSIDAPFQMYALLYVPSKPERTMFALRQEDGLQLYARKVLIQDYCTDLLPRYYRFIQGVIDSEDIPLNVTRETMQANRVILTLKKILTGKVTDMLKKMGSDDLETYAKFWKNFSAFICEGIVTEPDAKDALVPLLRYRTLNHGDEYVSLDTYASEMKEDQKKIFYLIGENIETLRMSPHLELLKEQGVDVLLMPEPFDPFVVTQLGEFKEKQFVNAAVAREDEKEKAKTEAENEKDANENEDKKSAETPTPQTEKFSAVLGGAVESVRETNRLVSSPARLVNAAGAISPEMQKMYHLMRQDIPETKKVLEINPNHALIQKVMKLEDETLAAEIIRQIYDNARIMDGDELDQAEMVSRIQSLLTSLLK